MSQKTEVLKSLLLKDLRIQCRARGLNPGGSRDALLDRVKEHMLETGDYALAKEFNGEVAHGVPAPVANRADVADQGAIGVNNNNYARAEGQNVGNFITDRPSSRVLAPPGGTTSFSFGGEDPVAAKPRAQASPAPINISVTSGSVASAPVASFPITEQQQPAAMPASKDHNVGVGHNNNYARPSGQNVGNFLTDKPSSRVLAPPGGGSSIVFG